MGDIVKITIETVREGMQEMDTILALVDRYYCHVIPWKRIDKFVTEIDSHKDVYSTETSKPIIELKSAMKNGQNNHIKIVSDVVCWYSSLMPCFDLYLQLVEKQTFGSYTSLIFLIDSLMDNIIHSMNNTLPLIVENTLNFEIALAKINSIQKTAETDFEKKNSFAQRDPSDASLRGLAEMINFYISFKFSVDRAKRYNESTASKLRERIKGLTDIHRSFKALGKTYPVERLSEFYDQIALPIFRLLAHYEEYKSRTKDTTSAPPIPVTH